MSGCRRIALRLFILCYLFNYVSMPEARAQVQALIDTAQAERLGPNAQDLLQDCRRLGPLSDGKVQLLAPAGALVRLSGNTRRIADRKTQLLAQAQGEVQVFDVPNPPVLPSASKEKTLSEADSLTKARSFFRANVLIQRLRKAYPNDAAVALAAARLFSEMGLVSDAETEYSKALQFNSSSAEALCALSEISLQKLAPRKALEFARRACGVEPTSARSRVALVNALVACDMLKEADSESGQLLHDYPNNAAVHYAVYKLNFTRGQLGTAQSQLQAALKLFPNNFAWRLDLADVCQQQGDREGARRALRQALGIDPYSVEAKTKMAIVLEFYFHDYDGAIEQYDSVLDLDSQSVTALAGVNRCRTKKNDIAAAIKFQLWNVVFNAMHFFDRRPSE